MLFLFSNFNKAQKVGLVLSGGGALGYAHIGVLMALEENNIPIDYITGTSAGAMVGSMYAAGWSPWLMDSLIMTDKFQLMSSGGVEYTFDHYFRKPQPEASWIDVKLTKDLSLKKIVPTNVTNPVLLDYESMAMYSAISADANYNFDSLFVPFRCVASDVYSKAPIVFKEGHLNQTVRASMTYPGYLRPIKVNGRLMFDGGLYNNFPTDVMYEEFFPDIIIGVDFSDTVQGGPEEDDVFSQIKSMIIDRAPTSIICQNGVLIQPDETISIFGFDEGDKAVKAGYDATIAMIDSLKLLIPREVTREEIERKRAAYFKDLHPIIIDEIEIDGVRPNIAKYIEKSIFYNNEELDLATLKKRYFRLVSDSKLKFIYPIATVNPETGKYKLHLDVYPEKPFSVKFGGVISSKPINTGYVGLTYARLGRVGFQASGESSFGKYYGSARIGGQLDFNFKLPFSVEGFFTLNRFDYFRSFATFFEESKPSFIIENDRYAGINAIAPISYFGRVEGGYSYGTSENNYYQTSEFTPSDTTDITNMTGHLIHLGYTQSSLNRKQFASEGSSISLTINYFRGLENTTPGSTAVLTIPAVDRQQEFFSARLQAQKYFDLSKSLHYGLSLDGSVYFTEKFLDNYTATIINSPIFQPLVESKALLLQNYASHNFVGLGTQLIYNLTDNVDFRAEGYAFVPFYRIDKNIYNQPFYSNDIYSLSWIGSGNFIYHSPLGPVSASLNYYQGKEQPWSFLVSFGYILHNKRFLK
ncbi:MAG: patatin-like phospholipase family protein [Flavobacteriales bacterium]|nr:patatin-like phospholipase family protein [Flavobacteriales bacterium]